MTAYIIFLAVVLFSLAAPALTWESSAKQFGIGMFVSVFGVALPLFTFVASACLVPEWKGGCQHGWVDCFHLGKLALTPLVLWATAVLYVVEIFHIKPPHPLWIRLGLFLGVIVATGCFCYGILTIGRHNNTMLHWLLVPLYVAAWHFARSELAQEPWKIKSPSYALVACGSTPFWLGGLVWSRRIYDSLPNQAPSCFVVTAASRGHHDFVGPFVQISRHGRIVSANQQLLSLWLLEAAWRARAPRSHAAFRLAYNRLGPVVARQINSPWTADIAFIALKPVEWLARFITRTAFRRNSRLAPPSSINAT